EGRALFYVEPNLNSSRVFRPRPNSCYFSHGDPAKEHISSRLKAAGVTQIRSIGDRIPAELRMHQINDGECQDRETSQDEGPDFCFCTHVCVSGVCRYLPK